MVKKVGDQWLYRLELLPNLFAGKGGEIFDSNGKLIELVGTLADGHKVYLKSADGSLSSEMYFALGDRDSPSRTSPYKKYVGLELVRLLYGHWVYEGYKYCFTEDPNKGAYFDGLRWIDKETGEIYHSPEGVPQGYEREGW
ncbi:MAG: hypothetical protein LBE99_00355 [Puniceicoccales bacterium]|jgi:hypothetical protein|nr:hypothetical protein [Puniceicoccales bacterium]